MSRVYFHNCILHMLLWLQCLSTKKHLWPMCAYNRCHCVELISFWYAWWPPNKYILYIHILLESVWPAVWKILHYFLHHALFPCSGEDLLNYSFGLEMLECISHCFEVYIFVTMHTILAWIKLPNQQALCAYCQEPLFPLNTVWKSETLSQFVLSFYFLKKYSCNKIRCCHCKLCCCRQHWKKKLNLCCRIFCSIV